MDWLINAFWARIGWALGEVALAVGIIFAIGIVALIFSAPRLWRQSRCKHLHFHETGKCDAICSDCGKNLGFIGTWRDKIAAVSRT